MYEQCYGKSEEMSNKVRSRADGTGIWQIGAKFISEEKEMIRDELEDNSRYHSTLVYS